MVRFAPVWKPSHHETRFSPYRFPDRVPRSRGTAVLVPGPRPESLLLELHVRVDYLITGNGNLTATLLNAYTGIATLNVDTFTSTGAYTGSSMTTARYFLSKDGTASNALFSGRITSGLYATGAGSVIFIDADPNSKTFGQIVFQTAFTALGLSYSPLTTTKTPTIESLSASPSGLAFSGPLFTTTETGNPNAGFGLVDRFLLDGTSDPTHHTGVFYASVGAIGVVPVPEPSSWAALSAGTLILLRRYRRA